MIVKEKQLGKHLSTRYFPGFLSIRIYERGYGLKLIKQPRIFFEKHTGKILYEHMLKEMVTEGV